ncbi:hypothetical protein SCH4B_3760 [Ruegeria sp. TrichCH4B]|nr:hypothetical protein SCH4B_3760 [Ruegeria sp. TrichCH4B]
MSKLWHQKFSDSFSELHFCNMKVIQNNLTESSRGYSTELGCVYFRLMASFID